MREAGASDRRGLFETPDAPYVLIVTNTSRGGMASHFLEVAEALAAAHPVQVLETGDDVLGEEVRRLGLPYRHQRLPVLRGFLQELWAWRAVSVPPGCRAVVYRGYGGMTHHAALAILRSRVRRLYTIEHSMPDLLLRHTRRGLRMGPLQRAVLSGTARLCSRLPHRTLAVSQGVHNALVREIGFSSARVTTCPNWIDTDRFRPDPNARDRVRRELGLNAQTLLVGYAGRMAREKRADLIVKAFAQFLPTAPRPAVLALAGSGPTAPAVQQLARQLIPAQALRLLDWQRDMPGWHNALDVEVHVSESEGCGLTVLEAMACGTLLIAHACEGVDESFSSGEDGLGGVIDDAPALARLFETARRLDPAERTRLITSARHRACTCHGRKQRLGNLLISLDAPVAAARLAN